MEIDNKTIEKIIDYTQRAVDGDIMRRDIYLGKLSEVVNALSDKYYSKNDSLSRMEYEKLKWSCEKHKKALELLSEKYRPIPKVRNPPEFKYKSLYVDKYDIFDIDNEKYLTKDKPKRGRPRKNEVKK